MATRNTKLIEMFWEPLYHYAKRREEEGLQRQREEGVRLEETGSMFGRLSGFNYPGGDHAKL